MLATDSSIVLRQSYAKNQTQIYDDLSLFIQIFKRLLCHIELTAINIQKQSEYVPSIQKAKLTLEELQTIAKKYSNQVQSLRIELVTFRRLTCRLLELITQYKIKYQKAGKLRVYSYFLVSLKEVEEGIRAKEEERVLVNIVRIMQMSVIKFCMNLQKSRCLAEDDQKIQYCKVYQNMKEKIRQIKQVELTKVSYQGHVEPLQDIEGQHKINYQSANSCLKQTNYKNMRSNEILANAYNLYSLYEGMDLDVRLLKTSYIYARNNVDEVEKDCLERNVLNRKLITCYYSDFEHFRKRRLKRQNRKNQQKTFKLSHSKNQRQKLQQQQQKQNKQYTRIRIKKLNQLYNQKIQDQLTNFKRQILADEGAKCINPMQESKVSYKLNNIYLTLDKRRYNKNRFGKPGEGYQSLARAVVQSKSNFVNQTYYNQVSYDLTDSMNSLRCKLKNKCSEKEVEVLRIKTQNDVHFKKESRSAKESRPKQKITEKTGCNFIHYPFQHSKYLQIGFIKNRTQQYTKNKKKNKGNTSIPVIINTQINRIQNFL